MNAVVEMPQRGIVQSTGRLSASEVVQHAMVVQDVMRAVMKPELHYGKIPGTDKPTLFQPGADVLCMTFRIAPEFSIEDLSTADVVRYRVTCRGVHQLSGVTLGSCVGEASSGEEKYKWRRAVNDKEFEATPAALRRIKYGKSWETKQVRTEPADVANTVLKMAEKRAKIGMVLNVTACSDMFGQDLEDLDATLRDSLVGGDQQQAQQPQQPGPAAWPDDKLNEREAKCKEWAAAGKTADDAIAFFASKGTLTDEQKARVRGWMKPAAAPTPAPAPAADAPADDIPWTE
jgi:hypothetical protein